MNTYLGPMLNNGDTEKGKPQIMWSLALKELRVWEGRQVSRDLMCCSRCCDREPCSNGGDTKTEWGASLPVWEPLSCILKMEEKLGCFMPWLIHRIGSSYFSCLSPSYAGQEAVHSRIQESWILLQRWWWLAGALWASHFSSLRWR